MVELRDKGSLCESDETGGTKERGGEGEERERERVEEREPEDGD